MKKIKNNIIGVLLVLALFLITSVSIAQTQAPPPPAHGTQAGNVNGGSAPIGEGLIFLLALGASYGAKKVYSIRRKLAE